MLLMKGLFALADELPGYRIAFMTIMNAAASLGAAAICALVAGLSLIVDETVSLQIAYFVSSVVVLLILSHRFTALNRVIRSVAYTIKKGGDEST